MRYIKGGEKVKKVSIKINGERIEAEIPDRMLLVQFIREIAGLTGTHIGCDTGHCGACTVLLNGKSVKSCLVLAVQADNSEVTTIEGVKRNDKLHPVQEAFIENFAIQCGYCTPGLIMNSIFLLERNPDLTEEEIKEGIEGNICRCNGYQNIVKAIMDASNRMKMR